MRMRNKPWVKPELDTCPFFLREPKKQKGCWQEWFTKRQPIHLELGCGKGWFIAGMAPRHPEINYIGIDLKDVVLGPGKRCVEASFAEKNMPIQNVALTSYNVEQLLDVLDKQDGVERIYINFCNPWPREKHKKRRLTYPTRLEDYKKLLAPGGTLYFKTDDDVLFEDTLAYLSSSKYEIVYTTYDLHADNLPENVQTEHEKMFSEKGIKIKALIAKPLA